MDWLDGVAVAPATGAQIKQAQEALGTSLPREYVAFLRTANGVCGPIGKDGYIDLWPVGELKERNDGYAVSEFAPGLLIFGSDGGDTAYAFDEELGHVVVEVPFIGLSRREIKPVAANFGEFIATLIAR